MENITYTYPENRNLIIDLIQEDIRTDWFVYNLGRNKYLANDYIGRLTDIYIPMLGINGDTEQVDAIYKKVHDYIKGTRGLSKDELLTKLNELAEKLYDGLAG